MSRGKAQAEYIVAAQCDMLLRLWSDPRRIPVFSPIKEKVNFLIERSAKSKPLNKLSAHIAVQASAQLVHGLLRQLRSMPAEIQAIRDCRELCQDLVASQSSVVEAHLRVLSENFGPKVRSIAPDAIWNNSVAMNAAYALNWSRISGSDLPMLPYESAGLGGRASELLGEIDSRAEKTSEAYTHIVDAWAARLSLGTLYGWDYRSAQS